MPLPTPPEASVSPIRNVFVLMLENHSFDNMLALSGIPGIYAATAANSNSYIGKDGKTYTCNFGPNAPSSMPTDPGHEFSDVLYQLTQTRPPLPKDSYPTINNGGFAQNYATSNSEKTGLPTQPEVCDIMLGFNTAQTLPALYQLASTFAVCDQWFSSLPGPTWPNRFFLHGASSNGLDHSPTSLEMAEWESIDGFRYPNGSIFDRLNQNGISWRLYIDDTGALSGSIPQVSSLHNIDVWDVHSLTQFVKDIQSGSYPYQYTFIEPNYGDVISGTYEGGSSQHPMDGVARGDALIGTIYKAIRNSPIWKQSLFIIIYDEHGGFYDSCKPGDIAPPADGGTKYNKYGFNFATRGVRVPAVVVSPYITAGVDHTIYDHSSVLATLEYLFGLAPLTQRDGSANNLVHLFSDTMRDDTPTELASLAAVPPSRAPLTEAQIATLDLLPVPEGSTLVGMIGVLLQADSKISGSAAAQARFAAVRTRGDARAYVHEVMAKIEAVRAARAAK